MADFLNDDADYGNEIPSVTSIEDPFSSEEEVIKKHSTSTRSRI